MSPLSHTGSLIHIIPLLILLIESGSPTSRSTSRNRRGERRRGVIGLLIVGRSRSTVPRLRSITLGRSSISGGRRSTVRSRRRSTVGSRRRSTVGSRRRGSVSRLLVGLLLLVLRLGRVALGRSSVAGVTVRRRTLLAVLVFLFVVAHEGLEVGGEFLEERHGMVCVVFEMEC
jgi:hypothetical protein